ncbi:ph-response sensor protein [Lambiella insularis]|nr:ph-response sensor protein [Lambiella insularis]
MTSVPHTPATTPRSLFSRLTAPLEAKATNISDFAISLDEPHRCCGPGDIVQGKLSFTALKTVHITHLVLCLHGFVKIFKNNLGSGKSLSKKNTFPGTGRGKRGPEYFGDGFATVFENESMICGERSFSRGRYSYGFAIAFPARPLPSSVAFERGRVSYMLTATVTRPTTVLPTLSCTCRLSFRDSIDIANVRIPQPQIITLEPVVRHSRSRGHINSTSSGPNPKLPAVTGIVVLENQSTVTEQPVPRGNDELSTGVALSNSSPLGAEAGGGYQQADISYSLLSKPDKAIRLQVELLCGGCLPGGEIAVQVSVNHVRPIRSLHGIIITLYRTCHLDREPYTPITKSIETKMALKSVPKSRTGLSGLMFSSDDPNMTFRVNLAQTTAHLIVDPDLLSAEVVKSIRAPEDLFPTITGVPGSLLAFRYCVEVLVDVQGKLASQNYYFQQFIQSSSFSNAPENAVTFNNQLTSLFRRESSVIAVDVPLVIGTKDSAPRMSKRPAQSPLDHTATQDAQANAVSDEGSPPSDGHRSPETFHATSDLQGHPQEVGDRGSFDQDNGRDRIRQSPLLEMPDASAEKSRLRSAEEQLMPSAPVLDDDVTSSMALSPQPSAPTASEIPEVSQGAGFPPYAMTQIHLPCRTRGSADPMNSQDDKQERERQRLLAEASAPDMDEGDDGEGSDDIAGGFPEPSAPEINDEHEYNTRHTQSGRTESLPEYQK